MANGSSARFDAEARFAQVEERVTNISSRLTSLDQSTAQGFAQVTAQITSLAAEFRTGQKTPWANIWAAAAVVAVVVGGAVWQTISPIEANVSELKAAQIAAAKDVTDLATSLPKNYVSTDVADILRSRAAEDRTALSKALDALQSSKVDRPEWLQRQDLINREIADLSARITADAEAIRNLNGGLPDLIRDLKARIERLEERPALNRNQT